MGKDLKGKELGVGILSNLINCMLQDLPISLELEMKRFKKLQECRQWIAICKLYQQT